MRFSSLAAIISNVHSQVHKDLLRLQVRISQRLLWTAWFLRKTPPLATLHWNVRLSKETTSSTLPALSYFTLYTTIASLFSPQRFGFRYLCTPVTANLSVVHHPDIPTSQLSYSLTHQRRCQRLWHFLAGVTISHHSRVINECLSRVSDSRSSRLATRSDANLFLSPCPQLSVSAILSTPRGGSFFLLPSMLSTLFAVLNANCLLGERTRSLTAHFYDLGLA